MSEENTKTMPDPNTTGAAAAEDPTGAAAAAAAAEDPSATTEDAKPYTQEQIDAMIAKAKAQAKRQLFSSPEEEAAWKTWKADQEAKKPEEQKISEITRQLVAKEQELETYKRKDTATRAGIAAKYLDFAVFETGKTQQEGEDFEDALKRWTAANPYTLANDTEDRPGGTGMRHKTPGKQVDGVEREFLAKNPNIKLND